MNNEKGLTLVELLVTVVITGLILVPLLTTMTGSLERTRVQGKDTQLLYAGQQVMEILREEGYQPGDPLTYYCLESKGCSPIKDPGVAHFAEVHLSPETKIYNGLAFFEITANVISVPSTNQPSVELVTVVKKV